MTASYICAFIFGFSAWWLFCEALAGLSEERHGGVHHLGRVGAALAAFAVSSLALVAVLPVAVP